MRYVWGAARLQSVRGDLLRQADAAALLRGVDEDAGAGGDHLLR